MNSKERTRTHARDRRSRPLLAFGIAVALAAVFLAAATLSGDTTFFVRAAGALWVFLLGLIAALPLVSAKGPPRGPLSSGKAAGSEVAATDPVPDRAD